MAKPGNDGSHPAAGSPAPG